jgi:hypothetical protein
MKKLIFCVIVLIAMSAYGYIDCEKNNLTDYHWTIYIQDSCDDNKWWFFTSIRFEDSYIVNRKNTMTIGWHFLQNDRLFLDFFSLTSIEFNVAGIDKQKPVFHGSGKTPGGCIDREAFKFCNFILVKGSKKNE